MSVLASIPSPTRSVWHLGPLPIRAYALCIVAGIAFCLWLTIRRWRQMGGHDDDVWDVAGWAVLFGIAGGRIYHVITDPELYFTHGKHPLDAFKVWDGGLGIWGAIALGFVGALIGCRRKGVRLSAFADAAAPGIVAAQGIGRWGNWFNNELYGGPTSLPWRLEIHSIDVTTGTAALDAQGHVVVLGYFQPTFLYESIWDLSLAAILVLLTRRAIQARSVQDLVAQDLAGQGRTGWSRSLAGRGNTFASYVMGYTLGRSWIEALRHDFAHRFLGLRLNDWVSVVVFLGALVWFLRHRQDFPDGLYTSARPDAGASVHAEESVHAGEAEPAATETASTPTPADDTAAKELGPHTHER